MTFEDIIILPVLQSITEKPENNAFFIDGHYYSYGCFGRWVLTLQHAINESEIKEERVGLVINDDIQTYAAIFALWMEGKCYVPLHPHWPRERCLDIIDQVGLNWIIDSSEHILFPERNNILSYGLSLFNGVPDYKRYVKESSLAYILFTSGSTGKPKGVQISRLNISAFMDSFWKTGISISEADRCLQCFDLSFDVSVQSFLVALTRGACVYTVPYGQVKYLSAAALIQEKRITFGAMAPSMLTYLRPYFDEFDASSMKICILTAEACPIDLIEGWFKCAGNTEIFDFYGPTEATIYCTYYKLSRNSKNLSHNGIVSIGIPFANVDAIIIKEDGSPAGIEEKGELCIAGQQITPGYWNNQDKNSLSFFTRDNKRYYHTGDLCYWDKSGNIMYSGRIDQQAKIQGFRVELGEIEFHARKYFHNSRRVIAIAFQNPQHLTEIALFIESDQEEVEPLLEYLRNRMPHYMIPTRILFEPHFPLNKSEKVDRNALKQSL